LTAPLRLAFAGTPEFAAVHLRALLAAGCPVTAVYTQPDRPAGRGRQLTQSPVKALALAHSLEVHQPATLKTPEAQLGLTGLDLLVVVAYGLILPAAVLALPRLGCINVHASLLPRWRGAAPIQRAIAAGDTHTGISIMQMDAGLDTGPVLAEVTCPISAEDTGGSLQDRLAELGPPLLLEVLEQLARGSLTPRPQNDSRATYAPKIDKAEAAIDWRASALAIDRRVRAFNPIPVAHARREGLRVRVWAGQVSPYSGTEAPGTILDAGPEGIRVACGEGAYLLREVQLEGRKRVTTAELLHSRAELFAPGTRFEL
jgi:methionyl-tRNA formyltransferase